MEKPQRENKPHSSTHVGRKQCLLHPWEMQSLQKCEDWKNHSSREARVHSEILYEMFNVWIGIRWLKCPHVIFPQAGQEDRVPNSQMLLIPFLAMKFVHVKHACGTTWLEGFFQHCQSLFRNKAKSPLQKVNKRLGERRPGLASCVCYWLGDCKAQSFAEPQIPHLCMQRDCLRPFLLKLCMNLLYLPFNFSTLTIPSNITGSLFFYHS